MLRPGTTSWSLSVHFRNTPCTIHGKNINWKIWWKWISAAININSVGHMGSVETTERKRFKWDGSVQYGLLLILITFACENALHIWRCAIVLQKHSFLHLSRIFLGTTSLLNQLSHRTIESGSEKTFTWLFSIDKRGIEICIYLFRSYKQLLP